MQEANFCLHTLPHDIIKKIIQARLCGNWSFDEDSLHPPAILLPQGKSTGTGIHSAGIHLITTIVITWYGSKIEHGTFQGVYKWNAESVS